MGFDHHKTENELDRIFASVPIGICIFDAAFRYARLNRQFAEISGAPVEAHIGKTPREVDVEKGGEDEALLGKIMETGQSLLNIEISRIPRVQPGVARYWNQNWVPIKNNAGSITGVIVYAQEITARKKHLRDVLDNVISMIGILTPEGNLLEANHALLVAAGAELDDIRGKSFEDCYWWGWSKKVQKRLGEAIRKAAAGQAVRYDEVIHIGENEFKNIDLMISPIFDNGDVGYLVLSATDITERKISLEFLNLLNESKSIEDLIEKAINFVSEKTGCQAVGIRIRKGHDYPYYATLGFPERFVRLENSLCSLDQEGQVCLDSNGYPVLECMCGNVIRGRFDPALPFFTAKGTFWTNSTTELLAGTSEADRQSTTRNRCHGEGYESVALIPLRCGEERLGILQLNDMQKGFFSTETILMWERLSENLSVSLSRLTAEEMVQQMNATLEQKVGERTRIAETRAKQLQSLAVELVQAEEFERQRIADLLHDDLQQLIASARMQVQLAFEKADPGPTLKNVERLLGDSLEKSRRLSHELSPPVLQQFGLAAALEWLVRHVDEQFELKVTLETTVSCEMKDTPLKVFLFRAAQELLFNSVKHSGVKTAHVRLYDADSRITLSVSDNGQGFDPAILDSYSRKTGFGLVSLRARAAAIGGNLEIESAPGQGSRFILTVPIRLAALRQPEKLFGAAALPSGISEKQVMNSDSENIRVLFADDHKVMRQGLIGIISDQPGIQVCGEASSGEEALALAERLRPDIVIMDVSMPGMGGLEATRRIKKEMPEIRVIALSMFEDEDIALKMRQAGADGFISKSESSSELLKAIYAITGPCFSS
jgi:PAS domain S-box-containing protein